MSIKFLKNGTNTSDATATADDITVNKTAYVNGKKVTGNLPLFPNTRTFTVDGGVTDDKENSKLKVSTINATKQIIDSNLNMVFSASYNNVAEAIGLISEKVKSGETILGVAGTLEQGINPDITIPEYEYGLENMTSGELDNDTGVKFFSNENLQSKFYDKNSIVEVHATNELVADTINLTPDILKKDETIIGVTGTYEGEGGDDVSNYINMEPTETEVRLTYLITNVPEIDTSNVTNMDYMFQNFANLTTIPQLDTSSVTSMRWMFYGCTGLTTIPQLNTSNVTNMIYMFQTCSSLTTIPLLNTSNVMEMYYMFSGCSNLTEIPQLDTSTATRMDYMFHNCKSLTTIPQLNTSNVVNMSYMFYGCTSLTTIPLIDTSSVKNMWSMFSGCSNLTSVPQLNTSSATNMSTMFRNCSNLVTIPQLNMSNVTNVQNMVQSCYSLSDDSLNNILASLLTATSYTGTKTLNYIGLSSTQATTCTTLSNWSDCEATGWTTGY